MPYFVLACHTCSRTADAGAGWSLGQHRSRRGHSSGILVRHGWSWSTGVASGIGARFAALDEHHDSGDSDYAAGEFWRRCRRPNAARRARMKMGRAAAGTVLLLVIVV